MWQRYVEKIAKISLLILTKNEFDTDVAVIPMLTFPDIYTYYVDPRRRR